MLDDEAGYVRFIVANELRSGEWLDLSQLDLVPFRELQSGNERNYAMQLVFEWNDQPRKFDACNARAPAQPGRPSRGS